MFDRKTMATTIREAADKAGNLVVAALAVSACALLVALAALVIAVKVRHAH